jgi:hypothetical protein
VQDTIDKLSKKWNRAFEIFIVGPPDIFAMYLDEKLTGWAAITERPIIDKFNGDKCVLIPLSMWMMLKSMAADTVTPFRIVAKGNGLIEKAFIAHTGLKYAVRSHDGAPHVFIPVKDFKNV